MRYLKIFAFLFLSLTTSKAVAQKTNAEKILGCWVFKKIEFKNPKDIPADMVDEAQNSVVCFDSDGKFTTTLAQVGAVPIHGHYEISADGKTLTQKQDSSGEEGFESIEEDAEIELLDDQQLIFKFGLGTIYFDRK
ncbi:hypothetical protein [Flavobacterium terrisoli]|uniref:hypothetical protein n=1 Tax=Flavobacterium terrisoli TaxID=3242195 RepID=UPI0025435C6D|nr:hypothetical protein [Flavobacterium buctense]